MYDSEAEPLASEESSSGAKDRGKLCLSRTALYELVWSKPMTEIARLYGVRNDHVAKACDRHDVPRPPTGHWQKLTYGKPTEQPPLVSDRFAGDFVVAILRVDR